MVKFNVSKDLIRKSAGKHLTEDNRRELTEIFGWLQKKLDEIPSEKDQQKWIKDGEEWFLRATKLKVKKKKEVREMGAEHEYILHTYTFKLPKDKFPFVEDEDDFYLEVVNWPTRGTVFISWNKVNGGEYLWIAMGNGCANRFDCASSFDKAIKMMESWIEGGGLC